ncbi:DNA repair protein rhp55 [Colletotrichum trifolii]|uniref:DNA repair protein rhp55 n=1 Tax=Colletotrichum trifolii TaxID=5466 RepID=A0A4R8QZJ4_COLTR|nr:DNA repair protein rhp55 [Colletotrichum trifolii]
MESYRATHGEDIASFDLPSTHRLPTVSAAQALEALNEDHSRQISTGLETLDELLASSLGAVDAVDGKQLGGVQRGQVTEVWGPPGSGKTALGIQLVANAVSEGHSAVWIGPSTAAKRLQALQYIVSALGKLAATKNCAVVVLTQCATKMQSERGPTLIPSINAGVWEQGISTRLLLFRDWVWRDGSPLTACIASVQKLDGKAGPDTVHNASAFTVEAAGLVGVHYDIGQPSVLLSTTPRAKRKLAEAGLEVPDSDEEGEEYGWEQEDDAALPGMPPQWQGSEDLLLGTQGRSDDEGSGGSEDDGDGGGGDNDHSDNDNGTEKVGADTGSGRDDDEEAETRTPRHTASKAL